MMSHLQKKKKNSKMHILLNQKLLFEFRTAQCVQTDILPVTVSRRCSSSRCGSRYGSRLGITVRRIAPLC